MPRTRRGVWDPAAPNDCRLLEPTPSGAWMSTNVYDGKLRRRIQKDYRWSGSAWVLTNELRFVYDGNVVLQERDGFNLPNATLTRGLDLSGSLQGAGGIGGLLALSNHKSTILDHNYFHSDGNGNVTCLADAQQKVVARYLYDPFGNMLSISGPKAAQNRYRFSSKPIHEPSGMYDYLYRWYAPELQRWPNRDPLGEPGGELVRLGNPSVLDDGPHFYSFVHNNPITQVDPDGRVVIAIPPIVIGGGIAISVADAFGLTIAACLANTACRNAVLDAIAKAIEKCKPRGRSPEEEEKRKECVRRCHQEHDDPHELSFCIRRCNGGWNSPPDRPTPPGPIR